MKICEKCGGIAEYNNYFGGITCTRCGHTKKKLPTNADKHLRQATDEELAELFSHLCCPYSLGAKIKCNIETLGMGCKECWLRWLTKEAEE